MDFRFYEHSIMIPDQSAWQQAEFSMTTSGINIYKFFESKDIQIITTPASARELSYQAYHQTLFGGRYNESLTASGLNSQQEFVLSSTNGSLTFKNLDQGYPIEIVDKGISHQGLLWDSSVMMKKMLRNRRSDADPSNIYLGRSLQQKKKSFFIFLNDQTQIKQVELEGFKYLRPDKLIRWMVRDGFISWQKALGDFKKKKKENGSWYPPNKTFKELLQ
jgi:hypothetical protein